MPKLIVGNEVACRKCGKIFIITETMAKYSGYTCSKCHYIDVAKYVAKNRQWKRDKNNEYLKKLSPERKRAKDERYKANHPDQKKAHQDVQSALRNGTLVRLPCEVCGEVKSHAHHDDYSKTLEVRWFCHKHHMELHNMKQREEKR